MLGGVLIEMERRGWGIGFILYGTIIYDLVFPTCISTNTPQTIHAVTLSVSVILERNCLMVYEYFRVSAVGLSMLHSILVVIKKEYLKKWEPVVDDM